LTFDVTRVLFFVWDSRSDESARFLLRWAEKPCNRREIAGPILLFNRRELFVEKPSNGLRENAALRKSKKARNIFFHTSEQLSPIKQVQ
jgi:hypothetical protein